MIRIGINLPTFDPLRVGGAPQYVEAARLAEQAGFDHVWVGDHLAAPAPNHDAVVALAAAAAVTERVGLGFAVMLLGLREPAWAAKQLAAIDALAPGRMLLGVGVGGEFPAEFEAVGLSVRRRGRLLDAAIAALPDLLRGRASTVAPGTATARPVPALAPAISQLPPIWVGGRSEAALRRAARVGDAWLANWMTAEKMRQRGERLAQFAAEYDRPVPRLALALSVCVDADAARAHERAAAYTKAMYGLDFERVAHWTPTGSAETVAEYIAEQAQAGVEEFVITPLSGEPLAAIETLAELRSIISIK